MIPPREGKVNWFGVNTFKTGFEKINLESDKEQISRVFLNLIKNSIESINQKAKNNNNFTKKIAIELTEDNSHIRVNLEDNGIGFSELKNNIKDILNPYFTTKKNGTGLGLSIVNKIINDHNGKIDFIPIKNGARVNIIFLKYFINFFTSYIGFNKYYLFIKYFS